MITKSHERLDSIIKEYTKGEDSGLDSALLGIEKLDADTLKKIELLISKAAVTLKINKVENQRYHLQKNVLPILKSLQNELNSRIGNQTLQFFRSPHQKEEQAAIREAKMVLDKLDRQLEFVALQHVAISEFIANSSFSEQLLRAFELFIPQFIANLIEMARALFFDASNASNLLKIKNLNATIEDSNKKKEELENNLKELRLKPPTDVLKNEIEETEQKMKTLLDTIEGAKKKLDKIESLKEKGRETRRLLNDIGGEPSQIFDHSTDSVLDGMYISVDKFRSTLQQSKARIATIHVDLFRSVLTGKSELAADEVDQFRKAFTDAKGQISTFQKKDPAGVIASQVTGFAFPIEQEAAIHSTLSALEELGWEHWQEGDTLYLFHDEDTGKIEEWYTTESRVDELKEDFKEITVSCFSLPSKSDSLFALKSLGIENAGWKICDIGRSTKSHYLLSDEDNYKLAELKRRGIPIDKDIKKSPLDLSKPSEGGTVILTCGNGAVYEAYKKEILAYLMRGMNVMTFNFSGFGESTGKPSFDGLKKNMEAAYNHLQKHHPVEDKKLLCKALCMSGGPATYLAGKHPEINLFLDQTYADFILIIANEIKKFIEKYFVNFTLRAVDVTERNRISEIKKEFLKWADGQIENIAYVVGKLSAPPLETCRELKKVKGHVGLLFTSNDAVMKLDKEIYRNYKALTESKMGEKAMIIGMEGAHGDSWITAKGGGIINLDRQEVTQILQAQQKSNAEYIKKRQMDPFASSIQSVFTELDKLCPVLSEIDPFKVEVILKNAAKQWFPDDVTLGINFLKEAFLKDESFVGRQQMDLYLEKAQLKGNIYL